MKFSLIILLNLADVGSVVLSLEQMFQPFNKNQSPWKSSGLNDHRVYRDGLENTEVQIQYASCSQCQTHSLSDARVKGKDNCSNVGADG